MNWLSVAVAAVAYYLLGAIWFTPLLGRAWDAAVGFDRPARHRFPAPYYVVPLLSALVVTVVIAVLFERLDVQELSPAAAWGATVGAGYAAISFNNAVAPNTPRPGLLGAVTGGYHLVGVVLVSLIVTVMR